MLERPDETTVNYAERPRLSSSPGGYGSVRPACAAVPLRPDRVPRAPSVPPRQNYGRYYRGWGRRCKQRRQNLNSGSTAMAHENLARRVLGKGLCMGTSCRLHQATVMRGSL